jgi:hypothetical protein
MMCSEVKVFGEFPRKEWVQDPHRLMVWVLNPHVASLPTNFDTHQRIVAVGDYIDPSSAILNRSQLGFLGSGAHAL